MLRREKKIAMSSKRIVNCAITGSIHAPSMSPYLPYKPQDIARHAIDAANAGAASVHIHVRDPETGAPSARMDLFGEVIDRIRTANKDVIICTTTGGGAGMTSEERVAVVKKFKPELASMNAGSINWGLFELANKPLDWKFSWEKPYYESTRDFIFTNTFQGMTSYLEAFREAGTKPELEVYDVGHLYNIKWLKERGYIGGRPYLQFVMGITGGISATPYDLQMLKETADRVLGVGAYEWSALGAGRAEFPISTHNLFLGGHVRVGMEDNLNLGKGRPAKSNAELVEKMVRIMREFDFEPASPDETRAILGLTKS